MRRKIVNALLCSMCVSGVALASEGKHWEYKGETGPEHWGDLASEYTTCKTGASQSPININFNKLVEANLGKIDFNYKEATPKIINNGHTIQVDYQNGSEIKVGDDNYKLQQFHFHAPSENMVNGKPYQMEMHLVHKNDKGDLAVVAVFFNEGESNAELQKAWDFMPKTAGSNAMISNISLNATKLLPKEQKFAHFKGSLTTPPCSEGVSWFVMKQPMQASREQIGAFLQTIGENARPVQALNNRFVLAN